MTDTFVEDTKITKRWKTISDSTRPGAFALQTMMQACEERERIELDNLNAGSRYTLRIKSRFGFYVVQARLS